MSRWAIVTVVLYIVIVAVVLVPAGWWLADKVAGASTTIAEILSVLTLWQSWLIVAAILLAQLLMLVFPVHQYTDSPVPQRAIWMPVLTAGVLLSVLLLGLSASVVAGIRGEDIGDLAGYICAGVLVLSSWVIWSCVFYSFGHTNDIPTFAQRLSKWLIRASIVELLVAVPCHIVVRHRNDCCAPGLTFFGIAAGLAVMAIAFGPSVLLLANARVRQMQSKR